ncbi:hypothetical protein GYMLUDRAFT_34147 [Collybiopsis luxurians FD-317 M1]|nr:hypothetical protein GYMLUDRAFT_34147 [Collybiopsis luxurians FD-317 M1]
MRPWLSTLSCLLPSLLFLDISNAVRIDVNGRRNAPGLSSSLNARGIGASSLNNSADISYFTDITLNGTTFSVLIDTGSSDLWVVGSVSGATKTGFSAGVSYAVGSVEGPIELANLDFGGYTVTDQAFIAASASDSNPSGQGLIGLGPNSGSNIYSTIKSNTGASVCDRIFLQNTSTPNFITVNLGRLDDPSQSFPGNITIGEILDGLDSVTSNPKLSVTTVSIHDAGDQHFQVLLDSDGIIGPDNQSISYTTEVDSTSNSKQATAVFDTGFSLSQVPNSVANAFYSRFSGAEFVNVSNVGAVWIVPCDLEVNLTFKMGGTRYPVHPLDATLEPSILGLDNVQNSEGKDSCIGLFQPVSFDTGSDPTYDFILGMSFLRNVYALFNYGDFVNDNNGTTRNDPYIQLLSTTDPSDAHKDFVTQRLNGVDSTGSQTLGAPTSGTPSSSKSSSNHKTLYFGLAIAAGVLAIIFFLAAFCIRRNKSRPVAAWVPGRSGGAYAQLSNINGPRDGHLASTAVPPYTQYDQRYDHNGEWGQTLYDPAAPNGTHSYPLSQYPSQPAPYNAAQQNYRYSNPFEPR